MEFLLPITFSFVLFFAASFAVIPGLPTMFFLLLLSALFGFIDGFVRLAPYELLGLAGIYLVSLSADLLSGVVGAKYGGASMKSVGFGILGAVAGLLIFPPLGGILGLFLGVLLSEYLSRGDHRLAVRAASYGVLGIAVGLLINIALALIFLITFITLVFFV